jgi:plastocyanin
MISFIDQHIEKSMYKKMKILATFFVLIVSYASWAQEETIYVVNIENHKFIPNIVKVPAGKRIVLVVKNKDNSVEEFESVDLKREKIIPSNGEIKIIFGPLKPGEYKFFGEFHEKTAQGKIIAE